jgi:signal transduction histidine kinase
MSKIRKLEELIVSGKQLNLQNKEKEKRAAKPFATDKEFTIQNKENKKLSAKLLIANKELIFQDEEKEKRAAELVIANKELVFQNDEKEKRAAELVIANKELLFQDKEKEKRAAELVIANKELIFQNNEKEIKAAELIIANKELIFQNDEKEKRAAELNTANKELVFQNDEKEKRAAELIIANKELVFQNKEKEKRGAELIIANEELAFQNDEKEKRAAELNIANKELVFQNNEKEKRAAELIVANNELAFQNEEKEKRAAELIIANKELAFQNEEKEKRAAELVIANKELLAFTYVSSHDLQEPLRKIQTFVTFILEKENKNLSEKGKYNFSRIQLAAGRMQLLIEDLLAFSRISTTEHVFIPTDLKTIIDDVQTELKEIIHTKKAIIEVSELCLVNVIFFQFRQLMYNLISNALKFSNPALPPHIKIKSRIIMGNKLNNEKAVSGKDYCQITIQDNGIGFEPHFSQRIFEVFQKLHSKEEYAGTGIGLAIVKKIVENHHGTITAIGELNKGATFDICIPISFSNPENNILQ